MEKFKISEVCNISNGFAFKSEKYVNDNGARVIRITNVQKGKIVDNDPKLYPFSELDKLEAYKIFEGDILMSLTGNVGRVGRFPKELLPAYINQRVCRVMPKNEKLDVNFLFHFLNSDMFENDAVRNSAGAAQLNLSTNWLAEYEIPLPNLAIQQRIAAILDQADAIIQNNRAIVQKYDALTQSLFLDMFGDPVKNEKGWEKNNCRNILKVIGGGVFKSSDYVKNGIPLIRIGSVNKGYFDDRETVFIPETYIKTHKKYLVYPNDLLITLTGTVGKNDYGNVFKLGNDYEKYYLNQRVAKFEINETKIDSVFFEFYLKQNEIKKLLTSVSRGVRQANISNEDIYNLEIILPSINLQNQFAERVAMIEAQKQQAQLELAKSEELFQSLLQRAFKGELS